MVGRPLLFTALIGVLAAPPEGAARSFPEPVDLNAEALHWISYRDRATGTVVEYPDNLFSVEGTPFQPGSGRSFRTADGRASLTVYALPNRGGDTALGYLQKHLAISNKDLDYRRVTNRFFAISGIKQGKTFYSRCNFSAPPASRMHCILLVYPARENRLWDRIVTRISLSLHPARSQAALPEKAGSAARPGDETSYLD